MPYLLTSGGTNLAGHPVYPAVSRRLILAAWGRRLEAARDVSRRLDVDGGSTLDGGFNMAACHRVHVLTVGCRIVASVIKFIRRYAPMGLRGTGVLSPARDGAILHRYITPLV